MWGKISSLFKFTGDLAFKTPRQREEWKKLHPQARQVALYAAKMMKSIWGYTSVVTSIYRSKEEQEELIKGGKPGVPHSAHCFWRAVDLRWNIYPKHDGLALIDTINSKFPRKDKRPSAILHGTGPNLHIHIQVEA